MLLAAALDPLSTLLLWLGPINIAVALFNLVPGFPLDGGRVLRATLWAVTGDLERATRWASTVGRLVGAFFIASGIAMVLGVRVPFFGTGLVGGLWMAFIGWFLHNAAARSYEQLRIRRLLEGVRVSQLMRTQGTWVPDTMPVSQLVMHHFVHAESERVPVFQDGTFVGLVGSLELRRARRGDWDTTPVREIMLPLTAVGMTLSPNELVMAAIARMVEAGNGAAPVIDDGKLVGMFVARDVGRWLAVVEQHEARTEGRVRA
jgi:CBS domain-containing protein